MENKGTYKTVIAIAAPAVAELVLSSLTQLVDTVMVGQLGAYAISAVGITNQPRFIMLASFIALNVGTTALTARFKGQRNRKDSDLVTGQAIFLSLAAALLLTIPGTVFARPMVLFMGADADTVTASAAYFRVLMLGFVPTVLPITVAALLRGAGDTRTPLRYNMIANIANICLNYVLINGKFGFPALGVTGAALATVLANCIACFMAFWVILRPRSATEAGRGFVRLRLTRSVLLPNPSMLKRLLRIGLPSAAEQLAMRAGLLIYTITITALGTRIFAAHQITLTILSLSFVNGQAFGIAAASLTGQALGRGDIEAAKRNSAACQKLGALISSFMGLFMFLFRHALIGLFTTEEAIIALGSSVLIIAAAIQPFQSSFQIYAGALRGAGDSFYPALSLTFGILLIRPSMSLLLVNFAGFGLIGAWIALATDQIMRFFFILARYKRGKWVTMRV